MEAGSGETSLSWRNIPIELAKHATYHRNPLLFLAKEDEATLAYTTEDAIRNQRLGSIPVRIIARGLPQDYAQAGIPAEIGEKLEAIWQLGQRNMLNLSEDSQLLIATKSGHMVIHDEPELVVQTILHLLPNKK